MHYAVFFPPFDELADPRVVADLATSAEARGWDGFFVWDHITYRAPVVSVADPWVTLAAVAAATDRIRIGALVTPLARRRPLVVARQTATLDHLSGGRLVVGVGLGGDRSREFSATGEQTDDRLRAGMLDEALDLLGALWSGQQVEHRGTHYVADGLTFRPTPVQRPHPPVWIAVRGDNKAPLRRAARWQGVFPIDLRDPDHLASVVDDVARVRGDLSAYDVVTAGPPDVDPRPWGEAGATWWLRELDFTEARVETLRAVIDGGPPR